MYFIARKCKDRHDMALTTYSISNKDSVHSKNLKLCVLPMCYQSKKSSTYISVSA